MSTKEHMTVETEIADEIISKGFVETINKDSLKTHISIDLDGKNIVNEEGHSLVGAFINMLHALMGNKADNDLMEIVATIMGESSAGNFTSVSNSGGFVRINLPQPYAVNGTDKVVIRQITSSNVTMAGFVDQVLPCTRGADSYGVLTQIPWDAAYTGTTGKVLIMKPERFNRSSGTLLSYALRVGTGTADTTIDDYYIFDSNSLSKGTLSIGPVATDNNLDIAYLPFSRSFTNSSQTPITIGEIGIYARVNGGTSLGGEDPYVLIARDKITPAIVLPAGSTVYATYTMKTSITSGNGGANNNHGFTYQFLQLLHALSSSNGSVNITPRDGISIVIPNSTVANGAFRVNGCQCSFLPQWDSQFIGTRVTSPLGIMVGTGTEQTVDITNFDLGVPLEHDSQVQYHNTWIEPIQHGDSMRKIVVKTLIRNITNGTITVGEIGLFVAARNVDSSYAPYTPVLIYRNTMQASERFTIPTGGYCVVSLTISLVV